MAVPAALGSHFTAGLQRHPGSKAPGSATGDVNVGEMERIASVVGGGFLVFEGLRHGNLAGLGLAVLGGGLAYRGMTGHCSVYSALDVDGGPEHGRLAAVAAGKGVKVIRSTTINRSPEVLYHRWRNLENLPHWMGHLISVKVDGTRSHWVAQGPAGMRVSWDAEIVSDEPERLIAWRSLEGSQIATAGRVLFTPLSNNRGTEVQVALKYDPPGGKLGSWLAWAFGEEPGKQLRSDLRRFKQLMEVGETPTVQGQSSGRHAG